MLKLLGLQCLILIVATCVYAGPPLAASDYAPGTLSAQCESPKCPVGGTTKDTSKPITLPYPLDCLLYIVCDGLAEGRVEACPGDLVYNKKAGKCDTRENANCVECWRGSR